MRIYEIDGKLYTSVTTILKYTESEEEQAYNNRWRQYKADCEQEAILEKASKRGDVIHNCLANWINKEPKSLEPLLEFGMNEDRQNLIEEDMRAFEWLASEQLVYSKTHKFAGTLDGLAKWDNKTVIVDFKTSNKTYTDYDASEKLPQLAAYVIALEEIEDIKIDAVIIANLNCKLKTRGFTFFLFDYEQIMEAKLCFLSRLIEFRNNYNIDNLILNASIGKD